MEPKEFLELLQQMNQPFYWYTLGAAVALILFFILYRKRQPRNIVAYGTKSGQVMVARSAIVELVQTSCEQIPEISKPIVKIKVKGKKKHFQVHVKLLSGGKLRAVEQMLQNHLRDALQDDLGIENLGRIDIVATGFKSGQIDTHAPDVVDYERKELPESTETTLDSSSEEIEQVKTP